MPTPSVSTARDTLPEGPAARTPPPDRALIGDVYLTAESIAARVAELGAEITTHYRDGDLVLVSVLKGAMFFMADLARAVDLPLEMDFMAISSYQQDHADPSHRAIRFMKDLEQPLGGRDVIVVEDIVDTGLTLHYILRSLGLRSPRSLEVCTLLDRPYRRIADVQVRYSGFTVPDDFFVGYGFDYRQLYRNLPYLAFLNI
ncbi:MAG TPA: hypoxanthine phosphoribosyltransferase [Thermoleophilia bacterium]|nr:hypoxanthine phosphoribosyltransferase [Thermoleophilia bacterium]